MVDKQLHQLANHYVNHPFVHPNSSYTKETPSGPKMNTAPEMVQITKLTIDVASPCGGNLGRNHTLVTMVFNRVGDFERRMALRETFGGAMKRHSKASIYFIVGKDMDSG